MPKNICFERTKKVFLYTILSISKEAVDVDELAEDTYPESTSGLVDGLVET